MSQRLSRRRFLEAGVGATVLAATARPVAAEGACDDFDAISDELDSARAKLDGYTTERTEMLEEIAASQAMIEAGRDLARGPHRFDQATRDAALAVGLDARPGMVFLEMHDGHSVSTATAWYLDDHHLVTNRHNVEDVTSRTTLEFWTIDGTRHEFETVGIVPDGPDVALLRSDSPAPRSLEPGASTDLEPGTPLLQIGNPGGFGKWVLTLGEFLERDYGDLITNVPGLQGVSGSPLLDLDGRVVGLTYGGKPKGGSAGGRPLPADTTVHTMPFAPNSDSLHVPIESVLDNVEGWL